MTKQGRYRLQGDVSREDYERFKKAHENDDKEISDKLKELDPKAREYATSSGEFMIKLLDFYEENKKVSQWLFFVQKIDKVPKYDIMDP